MEKHMGRGAIFQYRKFSFWGKKEAQDFPGGTVVKNPPANAGDMGSSPSLGRFHMSRSNWARVPQLLSLRSRARALQQEKPPQWEAHKRQRRVAPARHN